jgi:two-component system, NarL family, nitrate/nitrite response regulator NarL
MAGILQGVDSNRLTEREWKLVAAVARGLTNDQIAGELGTTEHVVKNYLRIVFDKTGMDSRLELALWYMTHQDSNEVK